MNKTNIDFMEETKLEIFSVKKKGDKKYGLKDCNGKIVLPSEYDYIHSRKYRMDEEGPCDEVFCFIVEKEGKDGIVKPDGKPLTPCVYNRVFVEEGCKSAIVELEGSFKRISMKNGRTLRNLPADESCVYTPDGTAVLLFRTSKPVIPPTVKRCEKSLVRGELDKITFAEGHTELQGWGFDWLDTMDHSGYVHDIVLPSTVKKIDKSFFSNTAINNIWVPKGMVGYFKKLFTEKYKRDRVKSISKYTED